MKNEIILVFHGDDPDGIIFAALFVRAFNSNIKLIPCSYQNRERIFRQLVAEAQGKEVWIGDIDAEDYHLDGEKETVLELLAANTKEMVWIDHHSGTRKFIHIFKKYGHVVIMGDERKVCTAELIRERELPNDKYGYFLARVARESDYPPIAGAPINIFVEVGAGLQKIISYYNTRNDVEGLLGLVKRIAKNYFWWHSREFSPDYKQIIQAVDASVNQAQAESFEKRVFVNIKGRVFLMACADEILYDKKTVIDLRDGFAGEIDGVAVYFLPPRSHVLFFSGTRSGFNAQKFCESMGGGGRDGDKGGFPSAINYGRDEFNKFVDFLSERLGEFIKNGG